MHSARLILALTCSFLPFACAPEDPVDDDTSVGGGAGAGTGGQGGGAAAAAGKGGTATGGTSGSGAATGGAGMTGVGGTPSTGGMPSTGGAGAGGMPSSGGMGGMAAGRPGAGAGGMSGSGSGAGGAPMAGAAGTNGGRPGSGGMPAGGRGGSGSGGSGSGGFNPCPATGPCKILPLGDSITDGIGFSGGYRVELFHLALEDDKDITFVGGSMNGPTMVDGQMFPRAHEGHSGWTISQIDGIVPDPALNVTPHIILLHIGTNDMNSMTNGAPDRLGTLIDQIVMDLPDALLVVSNIIPFPARSSQTSTYNTAVPGVVKTRTDAGKHVIFVDQFTGFPTNELGDGVHPNQAGYERMASKWYPAIQAYLP
jgi:lysophospholipase L1-like esterase